jgi:AsmA protein
MPEKAKKRFGILKISGIVIALLVAAVAAIPFLIDANQFRPKLELELSNAIGREVKVGNLKLTLLSGAVQADDIAIADDPAFSRAPFVTAKSLQIGVELKPLILSRVVRVTGITLDRPEITLIRSGSGAWNFSTIGGKSQPERGGEPAGKTPSAADVSVAVLKITDGRMTVVHTGEQKTQHVYDKVNLTARDLSLTTAFPFTFAANLPGGGGVKLEGNAGPVNRSDASLTPFTASLSIARLDLIASGFLPPDSGLAGLIDFDGTATSDGNQLQSKGKAKAEKIQVVKTGSPASRPVALDYQITHRLADQSGTLNETKINIGRAVARLQGTYDIRGASPQLKMRFQGDSMPAEELEAFLPAIGVTLPKGAALQNGTLDVDVTAQGPVDKLVSTGTVAINKARLAGFDLGSKVAMVAKIAGIKSSPVTEIEKFSSDLRLAPEGIRANRVILIVPGIGELSGDGTVGSNNALDFKMLAKIAAQGGVVGSIAGGLGHLTGAGNKEMTVPFTIRGTTSDPSFQPDVKGTAGNLLKSVLPGQATQAGQNAPASMFGDAIKGLLEKKKKKQ